MTHVSRASALTFAYIDLDPECTAGLYTMLESFEPEHSPDQHYGSVCDGADGAR